MTAGSWRVGKGGQLLSTPELVYATWKHSWNYSHCWLSTAWVTHHKNPASICLTRRQVQKKLLGARKLWHQPWCFLRGNVTMQPGVHGGWGDTKSFWPRCAPPAPSLRQLGSGRAVELLLPHATWSRRRWHAQSPGVKRVSRRAVPTSEGECWAPWPCCAPS